MNRIGSLCLDHVLYIACHTLQVKKNDSDFALGDVGHEVGCHVGHEVGCHVGHEVGCHLGHEVGCHVFCWLSNY